MLPYLQDKDGVMAAPAEEEYGDLDAIAEDMKKGHFKQALQALCDYISSKDNEQDKQLTEG